jgi:hypothetical protein
MMLGPVVTGEPRAIYIVQSLMETDLHKVPVSPALAVPVSFDIYCARGVVQILKKTRLSAEHVAFFTYQLLCAMKVKHCDLAVGRDPRALTRQPPTVYSLGQCDPPGHQT